MGTIRRTEPLMDWITCGSGLSLDVRRRMHTARTVCRTMVPIFGQTAPILCPSCGSRVI